MQKTYAISISEKYNIHCLSEKLKSHLGFRHKHLLIRRNQEAPIVFSHFRKENYGILLFRFPCTGFPASPCMHYDIPMRHERWRQVFRLKFFKRCSVMHLFLRLWIVMFTSQTIPCLMPPHYLKLVLPKYQTISNARVSFLLP